MLKVGDIVILKSNVLGKRVFWYGLERFNWEIVRADPNVHKDGKVMYTCMPILDDDKRGTAYNFSEDEISPV